MLIRRPEATEPTPVTMPDAEGVSMRMMVGRADGAPNFSMRHFTVEPGGHTPRHSHDYEHEVYVTSGRGEAESDGASHQIKAGDVLFVEPNSVHQFRNTGEEPLTFLCLVPSTFDCGGETAETPGS